MPSRTRSRGKSKDAPRHHKPKFISKKHEATYDPVRPLPKEPEIQIEQVHQAPQDVRPPKPAKTDINSVHEEGLSTQSWFCNIM